MKKKVAEVEKAKEKKIKNLTSLTTKEKEINQDLKLIKDKLKICSSEIKNYEKEKAIKKEE